MVLLMEPLCIAITTQFFMVGWGGFLWHPNHSFFTMTTNKLQCFPRKPGIALFRSDFSQQLLDQSQPPGACWTPALE